MRRHGRGDFFTFITYPLVGAVFNTDSLLRQRGLLDRQITLTFRQWDSRAWQDQICNAHRRLVGCFGGQGCVSGCWLDDHQVVVSWIQSLIGIELCAAGLLVVGGHNVVERV